jgi:hypothetical protein
MIGHPYLYIGKIHTQNKKYNNRMNVIVETLLQERNKIKDFEDECSALHHQVSSMDRDPQSTKSNYKMPIGLDVEENFREGMIWMKARSKKITSFPPPPVLFPGESPLAELVFFFSIYTRRLVIRIWDAQ